MVDRYQAEKIVSLCKQLASNGRKIDAHEDEKKDIGAKIKALQVANKQIVSELESVEIGD